MNKIFSQTLMFISTVFALGIISISVKADVNIYRLYNTTNLDHLWTTGTSEIFSLVESTIPVSSAVSASPSAWYGDEIAFTEPSSGTPVYRLNSTGSAGHLFTTDTTEVSTLTSSGKWSNEGIVFYSGGTIPVYRLYNSQGYHFFTTDSTEESNLVGAGWTYQKVAFYATGGARVYKGDSFGTPTADISGDITLSGTGAGYQAKIGMQDYSQNAISLGVQYDTTATGGANYNSKFALMSENVSPQHVPYYTDWAVISSGPNTTAHVELAYYEAQSRAVFLANGQLIGTNTRLEGTQPLKLIHTSTPIQYYAGINAKQNGDTVTATINNVQTPYNPAVNSDGLTSNNWNNGAYTSYMTGLPSPSGTLSNANFSFNSTCTAPVGTNWDNAGPGGAVWSYAIVNASN